MAYTAEVQKRIEEQEKKYDGIKCGELSGLELTQHFVESEAVARTYRFQGQFFGRAYFHLKDLVKSTMKDIPDEVATQVFYHLLRGDNLFKIHKKTYRLLLNALRMLMPDMIKNEYEVCRLDPYKVLLLFDLTQEAIEKGHLKENTFEEFESIRSFIQKSETYVAFPYMRKKRDKLSPSLENTVLMHRIRKGFFQYKGFDMLKAASLVLLLLDNNEDSKKVLLSGHAEAMEAEEVWILGSFYKDFQDMEANKVLLEDLYQHFPTAWIDTYQEGL